MMVQRLVGLLVSLGVMVQGSGTACAQGYPNKPVRIVTSPAGGGNDLASRLIAPGLSGFLGQPVIVENRPGVIAIEIVVKAPPDGYTLLMYANGVWLMPYSQKVYYDPIKDFSPVTMLVNTPNVIVVHPSLPAKTVQELITLAKAKPGELNYSTGTIGTVSHIATELFKSMADINIVHIPFKGAGPALNAVLGNQVQLTFASGGPAAPHIKSGRLRALAVTSAQPSALFPGLPTVAASGLPGYDAATLTCVFTPAKTPEAVNDRLNREILRVVNQADVKERFLASGADVVGSSPKEFAAYMKSDMTRMGKVIKDAGIKSD